MNSSSRRFRITTDAPRRRGLAVITLATLACLTGPAVAATDRGIASATTPFSIAFDVQKAGLPLGDTHFSLSPGDAPHCFVYRGAADPNAFVRMFLGDVDEQSRFCVVDGQIRPETFSHHEAGKKKKSYTLDFNWQTDKVAYRDEAGRTKTFDISPGVQDPLSLQIAARAWLVDQIDDGRDPSAIDEKTFRLADDDGVENFDLRVSAGGRVQTGAGSFDTIRVARLGDHDHPLVLWLTPSADYIPIKVETGSGDTTFTMTAKSLDIASTTADTGTN